MSVPQDNNEQVSYKDTLTLPHTDFPLRANAKIEDPKMLERWIQEDLYNQAMQAHQGSQKYILHDGPPYANGPIHLGHAYNKILKDIMTKAHRMLGFHVPIIPGWDCHGLPIELKVTQENPGVSPLDLKKACRIYAQKWIDIQREEFKKLGVIMDWEHPYTTMEPFYEGRVVFAFSTLIEKNFVERKNKSVPWCMFCKTVLAMAEIEYKDRKDPSVYVLFELSADDTRRLFPALSGPVSLVAWTTTPWTLPLNRAVALRPGASYQVLEINGKLIIIAAERADDLLHKMNVEKKVVETVSADQLVGVQLIHPFVENLRVPLIADNSVGLEEGTAFVHMAPGCGPVDYDIGIKYGLEIYSPISADGKYTEDIQPAELKGISVIDGQIWVIKKLAEKGKLLFKATITHSYPHCWRCHNGLIFRATLQWFFNLHRNDIKTKAIEAIKKIHFIPEQGRNFLRATLENRLEWCLSRQRVWGVPIVALLCKQCGWTYCTPELIKFVAHAIEKEGIEYWDRVTVSELVKDIKCPECQSREFTKETDILDVWFESGVSHYAVLYPKKLFPADLYLEGIDQHRAWFQSSLLNSLVLEGESCTKAIMTHGFTVDEKGQKMSKSIGNVVAPQQIIDRLGTDGLRLWVASIGNDGDAIVSEKLLVNVEQVMRKIRNTCRVLLMNLYDYDHTKDAVDIHQLQPIDQYQLEQLYLFNKNNIHLYVQGNFTAIFHELADYCANELSAFYVDILKDRLYVEKADGHLRRSAQTVLWHILDTLTRLIAPIMSFTAEQVSDFSQKDKKESIHLQHFAHVRQVWEGLTREKELIMPDINLLQIRFGYAGQTVLQIKEWTDHGDRAKQWDVIRQVRSALLKALEIEREKGIIKHSLDARITLYFDPSMKEYEAVQAFFDTLAPQQTPDAFMKELMIVSQCIIVEKKSDDLTQSIYPGVFIKVEHAHGHKCPRCWQWDTTENPNHLCYRCQHVLMK
ncbi:MAG: isoleucine--tRNA ligase [Candidatus Babeliaceae bacterium]